MAVTTEAITKLGLIAEADEVTAVRFFDALVGQEDSV